MAARIGPSCPAAWGSNTRKKRPTFGASPSIIAGHQRVPAALRTPGCRLGAGRVSVTTPPPRAAADRGAARSSRKNASFAAFLGTVRAARTSSRHDVHQRAARSAPAARRAAARAGRPKISLDALAVEADQARPVPATAAGRRSARAPDRKLDRRQVGQPRLTGARPCFVNPMPHSLTRASCSYVSGSPHQPRCEQQRPEMNCPCPRKWWPHSRRP